MKVPESIHLYGNQPAQTGVQDTTSSSASGLSSQYPNYTQTSPGMQTGGPQAEKVLQDIEQLLQDSSGMGMNGGMQNPMNGMQNPNSGMQYPSGGTGMGGGMQYPPAGMGMGGGMPGSMPYGGSGGGFNSPGAGRLPVGTPVQTASNPAAGTGLSGTTPVNLTIPGENKPVPLLMSQPDANGTKQLYATDGTHRGTMNAQGQISFDSENAANKVVNMDSDGHAGYDITGNGQGGYTLNAGVLSDGNLPS